MDYASGDMGERMDDLVVSNYTMAKGSSGVMLNTTDHGDIASYLPYITKVLTLITIILLAVFSNLLVIFSVILYRKLRGINNYFLVSLAFADLLVASCAMTLNATQEISGRWIFGRIVCDLWNSIDVHVSTVSTLHLCCISLDRYYAIVRPLEYKTTITVRVAVTMMIFAWSLPTLISFVPIFMGWYTTKEHLESLQENPEECNFVVNKPYAFISCALTFWCPVIVMLLTYQRVYREAVRQKRTIERLNSMVSTRAKTCNGQYSPGQGSLGSHYREHKISWKERDQLHNIEQDSVSNLSNLSEKDDINPEALLREKLMRKKIKRLSESNGEPINETFLNKRSDARNGVQRSRNSLGNILVDVSTKARLSIVTSTLAITEGLRERRRIHTTWRKEHKAFVTLGVVLGAFLICWLPFFTWYLTTTICGDFCDCPPQVVSVLFWIGYFNSTLNPIIYALTNQDFKIAFITILKKIFCCRETIEIRTSELL